MTGDGSDPDGRGFLGHGLSHGTHGRVSRERPVSSLGPSEARVVSSFTKRVRIGAGEVSPTRASQGSSRPSLEECGRELRWATQVRGAFSHLETSRFPCFIHLVIS
ncbi:hypothetical protein CRG98_011170 [Punica granatum]|uniref:Uncharacterized protein n=1 Tax=Punica granatum TaxID=22663 RepID=A0A2I0KIU9_PUNGR|nr:hypothetical protein CRG98_011170 [Punica granatum]